MNFRARIWRFFRVLLVNQVNLKRMCRNFNWITFISVNFAVSWASNTTNLPKSFSKTQKIHKIFLKENFLWFWLTLRRYSRPISQEECQRPSHCDKVPTTSHSDLNFHFSELALVFIDNAQNIEHKIT